MGNAKLMWDVLWYSLHIEYIITFDNNKLYYILGGEGGIRTHGTGKPYS